MNLAVNQLDNYNSTVEYDVDFENSSLKQILDNCEQLYNEVDAFIKLSTSNGWIKSKS